MAYVLALCRVDDGAGAQEEQRLKEGVCEEVDHGGGGRADAQRHEHQPQAVDRRVGDDALDIGHHQTHRRREKHRQQADGQQQFRPARHQFDERQHARHQVNAGDDHRRGVDQRGDGRRALHRVRQPDVERELGRLAHCA